MDAVRLTLLRDALAGTEWLEATRRFGGALRGSVSRPGARPGGLLLVGTEHEEPWHLAAHLGEEASWSGVPELAPTLVRHAVPPGAPEHLSVGLRRLEQARRGETVLVVAAEQPGEGLLERVHDARRTGATVLALEAAEADPAGTATGAGGGAGELRGLAHELLTSPGPALPVLGDGLLLPGAGGPFGGVPAPRAGEPERDPGTDPDGGPDAGLAAPGSALLDFDLTQHLVSASAGEPQPVRGLRRSRRGAAGRLSALLDRLMTPVTPPQW